MSGFRSRKAATILLICVVILASPFAVIVGYAKYRARPSETFCGQAMGLTEGQITQRAKLKGLTVMPWDKPENVTWIFRPEDGPMFRFACEVHFEAGKVTQTLVVDAD
jgi:hypothetical protein